MKILIIDDDKFLTQTMERALNNEGHDITVINKASVLETESIDFSSFNLILLDLMMRKPQFLKLSRNEETGEGIYRYIKGRSNKPKFIIITGKDDIDIATNFKRFGVPILQKPFNSRYEDLFDAIRDVHV